MINWTERVEKLELALTDGLLKGSFSDGRSFEYRSTTDLLKALQYARAQSGSDGARATLLSKFTKGVQC